MKQKYEIEWVQVRLLLWFIYYFFVALYSNFVHAAVIIVQYPDQILFVFLSRDIKRSLPTFIFIGPVCTFDQQHLNNLLFWLFYSDY